MLIALGTLFLQISQAAVLSSEISSGTVFVPISQSGMKTKNPFAYQINADPSYYLGPLIGCYGREALLVANGGLHVLNTLTLDLASVKGGEGFKIDGFLGVESEGARVSISIDYDCGDCNDLPDPRRLVFDFTTKELIERSSAAFSAGLPRGSGSCDLADGRRLEATANGLKIYKATGDSLVTAKRKENQENVIAGLEYFANASDVNPYPDSGPSQMSQGLSVENLVHLAASTQEKKRLLERVIASKAGKYAKAYARCTLAELYRVQGDTKADLEALALLASEGKDLPGIAGRGGPSEYCDKLLMPPEMAWISPSADELERKRLVRCVAFERVRRLTVPTLLRISALMARLRAYHEGKLDIAEAYKSNLLLEYVLNNQSNEHLGSPGDRYVAEVAAAKKELADRDGDMQFLLPERVATKISELGIDRSTMLYKNPSLRSISIYGPGLPLALDEALREGRMRRGAAKTIYEEENPECP